MATPPRLAPFLAQWDYMLGVLLERLEGLTDEEFLWEPADEVWTVRLVDGRATPDVEVWPATGEAAPPRTLVWTIDHLAVGGFERADYLVGSHSLKSADFVWPLAAAEGVRFMTDGLAAWRSGLDQMTDVDLDTVGRSAYPGGLDPELPLIEIVWWMNRELVFHTGEIFFARDLYAALRKGAARSP